MPGDTKGTLRERLTTVPLFKSGGEMMTSDDLARYGARIALEAAEKMLRREGYNSTTAPDLVRALLDELDPQHQGKAGRP